MFFISFNIDISIKSFDFYSHIFIFFYYIIYFINDLFFRYHIFINEFNFLKHFFNDFCIHIYELCFIIRYVIDIIAFIKLFHYKLYILFYSFDKYNARFLKSEDVFNDSHLWHYDDIKIV